MGCFDKYRLQISIATGIYGPYALATQLQTSDEAMLPLLTVALL